MALHKDAAKAPVAAAPSTTTKAVPAKTGGRTHPGEDEVPKSHDVFKGHQSDKSTDKMAEYHKHFEDTHHQGSQSGQPGSKTGTLNAPSKQPSHKLPHSYDKVGPSNTPKHLEKTEHKAPSFDSRSNVGASFVYVTQNDGEDARRFVKKLFSKGLIA
mmetsp:Transcript_42188/g.64691  ORF Transcript_42188/g.64691 Transcript_42188/m.64691 type:complete len:157 (-) Transcript_42188:253-723(-)